MRLWLLYLHIDVYKYSRNPLRDLASSIFCSDGTFAIVVFAGFVSWPRYVESVLGVEGWDRVGGKVDAGMDKVTLPWLRRSMHLLFMFYRVERDTATFKRINSSPSIKTCPSRVLDTLGPFLELRPVGANYPWDKLRNLSLDWSSVDWLLDDLFSATSAVLFSCACLRLAWLGANVFNNGAPFKLKACQGRLAWQNFWCFMFRPLFICEFLEWYHLILLEYCYVNWDLLWKLREAGICLRVVGEFVSRNVLASPLLSASRNNHRGHADPM